MLPIQRRPSCSPTPSTAPDFRAVAPLPEPGRGRWGGGPCNVSSVTIVYFPPTGNARQASAAMIGDRVYQTKPISHKPLIINCQERADNRAGCPGGSGSRKSPDGIRDRLLDKPMPWQFKIIVEKHADGYVAYPLGLKGVVVGDGNTYDEALADVRSAIQFHIETFGSEVLPGDSTVLDAFIAEATIPA